MEGREIDFESAELSIEGHDPLTKVTEAEPSISFIQQPDLSAERENGETSDADSRLAMAEELLGVI